MVKVAINGFGRIGRQVLRIGLKEPSLEFVAVNDPSETIRPLLRLLIYSGTILCMESIRER